jgi:hypothetical protein
VKLYLSGLLFLAALASATCLAQSWRPPRLADSRVDLQGVWNLSNLTPLERLSGFDSLVITREQARAIEERISGMRKSQPTGAADEGFDEQRGMEPIDGEWRSCVVEEPADGRIPGNAAFKAWAADLRERTFNKGDGPEDRPPPERCLSSPASTPPMLSVPTLNLHQIVQTPEAVLILSEWNHEARVVRMNGRHNPATMTSWLGDSIGWWEGDTLVVETRHFAATSSVRYTAGINFVVSPATVVTERFTRTAADELSYEFSVTDPTWYTTSWKGRNHLRRSSEMIYEFACHEGNYAVRFVLQGMRELEAAEARSEPNH